MEKLSFEKVEIYQPPKLFTHIEHNVQKIIFRFWVECIEKVSIFKVNILPDD